MKRNRSVKLFLLFLFLITSGCYIGPFTFPLNEIACYDCGDPNYGFIDTYRNRFDYNKSHYPIIKGRIAAVDIPKLKIDIIEINNTSIKGLPKINFWLCLSQYIHTFNVNDTIVAIMRKIDDSSYSCYKGINRGDYEEVGCTYSTLMFSNGNVTGIINTNDTILTTVSWDELYMELQINP